MSTHSSIEINIAGMSCGGCSAAVTRALEAVAGVISTTVTLNPGKAHIVFDATQTSRAALETTIEEAGYDIIPEARA
ncbi:MULTISPECIES: heavy-metal-associated domain-containing protein [Chitinibacter]|uniref:heavy-metal-associated domain-containing protein n=1 Tax=Chitinibacter TaxID=230666 RepID=UPI0004038290|nr:MULTISPECIES: cation transporter [Chitinibacter]